jgi:hypothetical protein
MKRIIIPSKTAQERRSAPDAPTVDIDRARAIWDEYQKHHDITPFIDQTAGIEPVSGRIWIGESAADVYRKKVADGCDAPIYVVRVGYDYYVRKGRRR